MKFLILVFLFYYFVLLCLDGLTMLLVLFVVLCFIVAHFDFDFGLMV